MWKWLIAVLFPCALAAQDSIYTEVDIVPLFPGCADPLASSQQQQDCSTQKLLEFVQQHLQYPDTAKAIKLEGVVVVRFVVDAEGRVTTSELLRDIGGGCGAEALRIVRLLPVFAPAQKNNQAVATRLVLPIRFRTVSAASSSTEDFFQLHWGTAYTNAISRAELSELMYEPLVIRDNNGDTYNAAEVEMNVIYKNKVTTEHGTSNKLSPAMFRLLQKAKPGTVITFSVHFLQGLQRIEVFREFTVQ